MFSLTLAKRGLYIHPILHNLEPSRSGQTHSLVAQVDKVLKDQQEMAMKLRVLSNTCKRILYNHPILLNLKPSRSGQTHSLVAQVDMVMKDQQEVAMKLQVLSQHLQNVVSTYIHFCITWSQVDLERPTPWWPKWTCS